MSSPTHDINWAHLRAAMFDRKSRQTHDPDREDILASFPSASFLASDGLALEHERNYSIPTFNVQPPTRNNTMYDQEQDPSQEIDDGILGEHAPWDPYGAGFDKNLRDATQKQMVAGTSQVESFFDSGYLSLDRCETCDFVYKNASSRRKHIFTHICPHICPHENCKRHNRGFATLNDLERHEKSVHRSGPQKWWKCAFPGCQHYFDRKDNFVAHIRRRHNGVTVEEISDLVLRSEEHPTLDGTQVALQNKLADKTAQKEEERRLFEKIALETREAEEGEEEERKRFEQKQRDREEQQEKNTKDRIVEGLDGIRFVEDNAVETSIEGAPTVPVYAKIHKKYLDVQTLSYYNIPWEWDRANGEYIIILQEMSKEETDILFAHTRRTRKGNFLLAESPKKRNKEFAWASKRDRSRSLGRKDVRLIEVETSQDGRVQSIFEEHQSMNKRGSSHDSEDTIALANASSNSSEASVGDNDYYSDHTDSDLASADSTMPTTISQGISQPKPEHLLIKAHGKGIDHGTQDDDTYSVASFAADINSVAETHEFSEHRTTAIKYLAKTFLEDEELGSLYEAALHHMNDDKFARNHRRLLKGFFLNAISNSATPSQRYALSILRSRRRRIELSDLITQRFAPEVSCLAIELDQNVDKLSVIDRYLASKDDLSDVDNEFDDEIVLDHLRAAANFLTTGPHYDLYKTALGKFIERFSSSAGGSDGPTSDPRPSLSTSVPQDQDNLNHIHNDPLEDASTEELDEHTSLLDDVSGSEHEESLLEHSHDDFGYANSKFSKHRDVVRVNTATAFVESPQTDTVVETGNLILTVGTHRETRSSFVLTYHALSKEFDSELSIRDRYTRQRVRTFLAELEGLPLSSVIVGVDYRPNLLNDFKLFVESLVRAPLQWWPLSSPLRQPASGTIRVDWRCSCQDIHSLDIPRVLAVALKSDLADAQNLAVGQSVLASASGSQNAAHPLVQLPSQTHGAAQQSTSSGPGANIPQVPHNPVQRQAQRRPVGIAAQTLSIKHHIFLLVNGSDYRVAQWKSSNSDDEFFKNLKSSYAEKRGWLRYWLSMYRFSHCDFRKLRKTGDKEFEPGKLELPDLTKHPNYEYSPHPMDDDPPISQKVFNRRFHACHEHHWYHVYHRCPRPRCPRPIRPLVEKVPKRDDELEEGGQDEEIFWGLYAQEWASVLGCVIWSIVLFILPQLIFVIYWLIRHPGDIQDSLAPWSICLAILPTFWGCLWLGNKDFAP